MGVNLVLTIRFDETADARRVEREFDRRIGDPQIIKVAGLMYDVKLIESRVDRP